MSIIRIVKHETNFLVMDKHCLENTSLSFAATGLHAYLMGLPNNWNLNVKDLMHRKKNGRDAIYTMINELIAAGYITRHIERGPDGKSVGCNYKVFERPVPLTGKPEADNPLTESQGHNKEPSVINNQETWVPGLLPSPAAKEEKISYKELKPIIMAWSSWTKGRAPIGRMIRVLRPLVGEIGVEEALMRLNGYMKANNVKYASIERFVQTHGQYEVKKVEFFNPHEKLEGEI